MHENVLITAKEMTRSYFFSLKSLDFQHCIPMCSLSNIIYSEVQCLLFEAWYRGKRSLYIYK
jgi:hypothetical protein